MPVYDRSYRRWDGELKRRALRFVPIVTMGVKSALGTRGGWFFTLILRLFMLVSIAPTALLFLLNCAFAFRPNFLPPEFLSFLDMLAPYRAVQYPLLTQFNVGFLMVYTMLFGSGLIAKDRASGALPLYLSRPLTLADYVLGKFGIVATFVAWFTLVPNLVLWLFAIASDATGHALRDNLPHLLPIVLQNVMVIATYSLTILACSAVCRRPMFAGLIWFALVVMLSAIAGAAGSGLGIPALQALSPNESFFGLGHHLFGIDELFEQASRDAGDRGGVVRHVLQAVNMRGDIPALWCWASLLTWCLLSLAIVLATLRKQEVVGESGRR